MAEILGNCFHIIVVLQGNCRKRVAEIMESELRIAELPANPFEMIVYRTLFAGITDRFRKD